jgi:outer membrane protein
MTRRRSGVGPVLAAWTTLGLCCALPAAAWAEALPEALVKAYQTNPQLNAERARQRATDETVPQALAGYRPQIVASLSAGLQAVRNLLPDNTIQTATLKPWTIGVTVCGSRNSRCSPVARRCAMSARACCSMR